MNNKGEVDKGIGMFLVVFVTLIVGLVLFQVVAQQAGSSTTVGSFYNVTYSAGAEGTDILLTGYRTVADVTITNATDGASIPSTNYTINNEQVVNGNLVATVTVGDGQFESVSWNISSASAQSTTYINDAAARSIVPLIAIFFAMAVLVVALTPSLRNGLMDMVR